MYMDPSHESHNALDKYPTMHHFGNRNVHIDALEKGALENTDHIIMYSRISIG